MKTNDPTDLDEIEPFESDELPADVNRAAEQEWKVTTTDFERVESILRGTTELQSAREISVRALVSEPTARKHLSSLVISGHVTTAKAGNTTLYRGNPDQRRLERIQHLADEHTREELETAIRNMKERIHVFETEYDSISPEELAQTLEPDDGRGWSAVSHWKATRRNLAFAKTAACLQRHARSTRRLLEKRTSCDSNPIDKWIKSI